jgi:hypothetical protein
MDAEVLAVERMQGRLLSSHCVAFVAPIIIISINLFGHHQPPDHQPSKAVSIPNAMACFRLVLPAFVAKRVELSQVAY